VVGFNAQVKEINDVAHVADAGVADPEGTVKGKSRVKISVKRAVVGAIFGAAIGAGAAVTSTLATEGPNLEFKTGTQFTVITNSPSHRKSKSTN
jgi:predicted regulator of Ras-like GTPase activity (Roadblock/LC7/MglB family)